MTFHLNEKQRNIYTKIFDEYSNKKLPIKEVCKNNNCSVATFYRYSQKFNNSNAKNNTTQMVGGNKNNKLSNSFPYKG